MLTLHEYDEAASHVQSIEEPFVVKPLSLSGGEGVHINTNRDNFDYVWMECIKAQEKRGEKQVPTPSIIIQNQVSGLEVRFLVTEGNLMSATLRVPSFIIGDGISPIKNLIKKE